MDELDLIRKIADKDHEAFNSLVDRYQYMVIRVCNRILGRHQDAEDAAQDVFVKIYQNAATFQGDARLSTWIYRIAVNLSLNYRRKQKWDRFPNIFASPKEKKGTEEERFEAEQGVRPDFQLEARERNRLLSEALETLPERQRTALILHKFEGLSYEEVSEVLDASLSSVESLIHRARLKLQKKLAARLKKS